MLRRAALAGCAIVVSTLALVVGPARAADALRPGPTYTGLLQALRHHTIRSATFDESSHLAAVVYRDGRTALVPYPAADSTLPVRMANAGVGVSIAHQSGGFPFSPPSPPPRPRRATAPAPPA